MRLAGLLLLLATPVVADPIGKIFWTQVNARDEMAVHQRILHPVRSGVPGRLPTALGSGEVEELRVGYDHAEPGDRGRQGSPRKDLPRMHLMPDRLGAGYLGCRGSSYQVDASGQRVLPPGGSNVGQMIPDPAATGAGPGSDDPRYFFAEDGNGIGYFHPTTALFPSRDAEGKYICQLFAFAALSFEPGRGPTSRIHLHRLPSPDGGPPADLGLVGTSPALSPDGRRLVFVQTDDATGISSLALAGLSIGGESVEWGPVTLLVANGDMRGRRLAHPSWRSDGKALVFASDAHASPAEESWNLYGLLLDPTSRTPTPVPLTSQAINAAKGTGGPATAPPELRVITLTSHQNVWPSFSPDGRHVLFASAENLDSRYEVYVKEVPEDLTPPDTDRPAEPVSRGGSSGADEDCGWPAWYQDLFAPSMFVELTPQDSGEEARISVQVAPDVTSLTSRGVSLKAGGRHLTPRFETEFEPADPVALEVEPDRRHARMAFGVHLGAGSYEDRVTGVTLRPLAELASNAGAHAGIQGFYVNKDARVNIKVIVRDNHHGAKYKIGIQDMDYVLNPTRIDPGDVDAAYPMFGAPYMPMADREVVQAGDAGFSWWFEDENHQPLPDSVNAPEFVFRSGNVDEQGKVERPIWFRAVARDLWSHVTEIAMPVFVYRTSIEIDKLEAGEKKKAGKEGEG